jgi:hypothetical protein
MPRRRRSAAPRYDLRTIERTKCDSSEAGSMGVALGFTEAGLPVDGTALPIAH